ncbi:MAG: hypothetical protein HY303_10250 [Candidatus Wallbacteria bacterium]|nr:hypothetical protein [Candidatus Wallbacteria bacterium]
MSERSRESAWPFALGTLVGIIPMLMAHQMPLRHGHPADPFDLALSYEIWVGGLISLSAVFSFWTPDLSRRVAAQVGCGLPAGFLLYFALRMTLPGLWPLGLILCSVIGLSSAYAGAFAGAIASRLAGRT